MKIRVNGEEREVAEAQTLQGLIESLGIAPKNLAIEHNGEFVEDDADWSAIRFSEGDQLEIVRFVGGG